MTMPIDLVLVRHGESEGNIAKKQSEKGDHSLYSDEFLSRHSSKWRLTDRGIGQAQRAGIFIREQIRGYFDRYYTSDYLRAKETALHLELPDARWYVEFYLRERDRGDIDVVSQEELHTKYAEEMKRREIDRFYWTPPNGESMAQLCLRVDRVLDTLHRECSDKRVIIVCHGEVMWAFRVRLERMTQKGFSELDVSKNPHDSIHNGQILHYTRRNPIGIKCRLEKHLNWMRSICPTDLALSSNDWKIIVRSSFSDTDLLYEIREFPRIINA